MNLRSSKNGESGWDPDDRDLWLEIIAMKQGALPACEAPVSFYRMEALPLTLSHLLRMKKQGHNEVLGRTALCFGINTPTNYCHIKVIKQLIDVKVF